jgi:hypothetical protein
MAVSGEPKRGYDDEEDPRRAVLWHGFGIVEAKDMIEEGEDKEVVVRERITLHITRREGPEQLVRTSFTVLHIFICLFLVSNYSYLHKYSSDQVSQFISLRTL